MTAISASRETDRSSSGPEQLELHHGIQALNIVTFLDRPASRSSRSKDPA
jgi:hypothetical protein